MQQRRSPAARAARPCSPPRRRKVRRPPTPAAAATNSRSFAAHTVCPALPPDQRRADVEAPAPAGGAGQPSFSDQFSAAPRRMFG